MIQNETSDRVRRLLSELTVEEKLGQLTQYFYLAMAKDMPAAPGAPSQPEMVEEALSRGGAGALLFVKDAATANRLQRLAIDGNRLGIPALFGFDVIHGLRTILPVPIALAATWDASVIERAQAVAAREARAVGIDWTFAPMVDIARDPRWGRMIEGAGEDPLLGSMVAAAQVRGFQGPEIGAPDRVLAGAKHFAAYGAALGGRDYDEVDVSDQELRNVYLPPFQAAIDAGVANIMSGYHDLNGVPATGNRWLLTDVLRGELGFEGFVVSDANSVRDLDTHHFAADLADAGVRALDAGVDLEMAIFDPAFAHVEPALRAGRIDEQRLDESVARLLTVKETLGLFDEPFVDEDVVESVLNDPHHREVAREAAEAAAVLLRNDGILPLDSDRLSSVAVIGPMARSARDIIGPWAFDFDLTETVTILDGLRTSLPDTVTVTHHDGVPFDQRVFSSMFDTFGDSGPRSDDSFDTEAELRAAVAAASDADVAVVVLGERQDMIGENASRSSLELPGDQLNLLQEVAATGTPIVLVLMNGRPLDLRWPAAHVNAILEVWYPGTQGGAAVANLLLGLATPSGKLPFTWPRTVGQVPIHHAVTRSHDPAKQNARYWDEESTPLFPFGHGLSYASFEFTDLRVDNPEVGADETVSISVDVTNTSEHDGVETVQLYLHQRHGSSSRPLRMLAAFERVPVAAGATVRATLLVSPERRRYWSAAVRDWVSDATSFDVWVGSSAEATLHGEFVVTGSGAA